MFAGSFYAHPSRHLAEHRQVDRRGLDRRPVRHCQVGKRDPALLSTPPFSRVDNIWVNDVQQCDTSFAKVVSCALRRQQLRNATQASQNKVAVSQHQTLYLAVRSTTLFPPGPIHEMRAGTRTLAPGAVQPIRAVGWPFSSSGRTAQLAPEWSVVQGCPLPIPAQLVNLLTHTPSSLNS